jgi:hypothetical protein
VNAPLQVVPYVDWSESRTFGLCGQSGAGYRQTVSSV